MAYNRPMHSDELVGALAEVPGTKVSSGAGFVTAYVPAIGDSVRLEPTDVLGAEPAMVPTGAPAVRLEVRRGHKRLPLIVTVDDVVFAPAYAADMLVEGIEVRVPAAPQLVAYSEMHRDVRALGRAMDDIDVELDPEALAATMLVHRCFLAGALRVGLWPVRVAAWWEYNWTRAGGDPRHAPFRPDPDWDRLMDDVADSREAS